MKASRETDEWIAKNIIERMRAHGLSQVDLAKKANVSHIHLNKIINLRASAGLGFLESVSRALSCSIDDLYRHMEIQYVKPSPALSTVVALLVEFAEASEKTRGDVFELLKRS